MINDVELNMCLTVLTLCYLEVGYTPSFPGKEGGVELMMLLSDWPIVVKCKTNSLRDNCILLLWLRHIVIVHLLYMIVF